MERPPRRLEAQADGPTQARFTKAVPALVLVDVAHRYQPTASSDFIGNRHGVVYSGRAAGGYSNKQNHSERRD